MTLTTIVALLQSALLLLTAAQSPNLPQSFRDNAMVVAQHAISQVTAAIASNAISTSPTHTFTTPSGAVVDASGNVMSIPAMSYTAASQTNNTPTLSISSGQVITTTNSAYISWTTNMPATSKVFVTKIPVDVNATTTQVLSSAAGMSTQGFVNISNLTSNTQYSYTIEAITDTQNQKISGTFSTLTSPTCTPHPSLTLKTFTMPAPKLLGGIYVYFSAKYHSNCSLDNNTTWLLDDSENSIYNTHGTFLTTSHEEDHWNLIDSNSAWFTAWSSSRIHQISTTTTYTLTVGDISTSTTVTIYGEDTN